ncbi:MAG: hypothetical protein AAFU64_18560, partial [Bacteroidota bacterium]
QTETEAFWDKWKGFDKAQVLQQISQLPEKEQGGQVAYFQTQLLEYDRFFKSYGTLSRIDQYLEMVKGRQNEAEIRPMLRQLEVIARGLLKVKPEQEELKSRLNEIQGYQKNIHLILDKHQAQVNKKYKDALPKAVQKDPKLEAEMVAAIQFQNFPGVSILRAILTDANWVDERNELGQVIGRRMEAVIIMKNDQGECFFQYFDFRQPTAGTAFGKTMRKASGSRYYLDCSKI